MPRRPIPINVAIDGPAGAGKSTVARTLARILGLAYVDTGALYRSAALKLKRMGLIRAVAVDPPCADVEEIERILAGLDLSFASGPEGIRFQLDGEDVSEEIRKPEISALASRISAIPSVRRALLPLQRRLCAKGGVVMEGRDIGTVVMPDAPVKIFLSASPEERARRRHAELSARGDLTSLDEVRRDMEDRDQRDRSRDIAPLVPAPDAFQVDTTDLSLEEVVARLADLIRIAKRSGKR